MLWQPHRMGEAGKKGFVFTTVISKLFFKSLHGWYHAGMCMLTTVSRGAPLSPPVVIRYHTISKKVPDYRDKKMVKRRIGGAEHTGLGGNAATLLDDRNTSKASDKLVQQFSKDVYLTFFKGTTLDYDMVDAQANIDAVSAGIEPSYQFDPLKIIEIRSKKEFSAYTTGRAVGPWASALQQNTRYYKDYKYTGKFTRFVDKWHPLLFGDIK